jgi:hypothetical protein
MPLSREIAGSPQHNQVRNILSPSTQTKKASAALNHTAPNLIAKSVRNDVRILYVEHSSVRRYVEMTRAHLSRRAEK